MFDGTRKFKIHDDADLEMKQILTAVYDALREKGYNPINQIVGYILSEDPTYITNHNNARTLIRKLDRDELLQELVNGMGEETYAQYLRYHFYICEKPECIGMSNHLLFVGEKEN